MQYALCCDFERLWVLDSWGTLQLDILVLANQHQNEL